MNIDVHIVLGKIQRKKNRASYSLMPACEDAEPGKIDAKVNDTRAEDIALMELPEELHLPRNSYLFTWLAGFTELIKPIVEVLPLREQTLKFLRWLDACNNASVPAYGSFSSVFDDYDLGEHSRVLYLVNNLRAFDYDQLAIAEELPSPYPDTAGLSVGGETYRELLGKEYFKLLNYCQTEGWDFIIFGFDG